MHDILTVKNAAIRQLNVNKGYAATDEIPSKETVEEVATGSQIEDNQGWDWNEFINGKSEKRTYWIAAGISIALIVLTVLAIKYKFIKL